MATTDKRIDHYIDTSAAFAKPILEHLRALVHKACPDVKETMKWSFPHFECHNAILCSMASFKQHCAFGFWNAAAMSDPDKILVERGETAMGHLGRISSFKDLPPDKILIKYIREAAKLNEQGVKRPSAAKSNTGKKALKVPDYFKKALEKNRKALDTFMNFSYSHKKEYLEWITEAKTEETRKKRMETAIEWMTEGKIRNWKYVKK